MSGSRRHLFLFLTLLAFVVLSEGSRLPKDYWQQMLPKKLPSPSSSPSGGTNSVSATSSTTLKTDTLLSSDEKIEVYRVLPEPTMGMESCHGCCLSLILFQGVSDVAQW
ncbi:hypothetical protein VNO77_10245 [Canavalia gladiata]|uniref:Uncharacterized protein n=1 Tax=Canavalia gladiata TaxID=3824 RepID=A0AAN9MAQ2_CANGL